MDSSTFINVMGLCSFLTSSFLGLWTHIGYSQEPVGPRKVLVGSMLMAYLMTEVSLHVLTGFWLAQAVFWQYGALQTILGQLGLLMTIVASFLVMKLYFAGFSARAQVERLDQSFLTGTYNGEELEEPNLDDISLSSWKLWLKLGWILPSFHYWNIKKETNLEYYKAENETSTKWKLDVYYDASRTQTNRPIAVYIHGGGWRIGDKREHGMPLIYQLASKGWICFSINYRLGPKNRWPKQIIDCKRAVAWIKQNATKYNGNPDYVACIGGSAGGHLATLLNLTPNDHEFDAGLPQDSTRIQSCVSFYGVYDFYDRYRLWPFNFKGYLSRYVMDPLKSGNEEWIRASPMDRITSSSNNPFFAIHGASDELVPVESCRQFCSHHKQVAPQAPLTYLELSGVHHAFDLLLSPRTVFVSYAVEKFLYYHYIQSVLKKSPSSPRLSENLPLQ